jgi:hypothetical protein
MMTIDLLSTTRTTATSGGGSLSSQSLPTTLPPYFLPLLSGSVGDGSVMSSANAFSSGLHFHHGGVMLGNGIDDVDGDDGEGDYLDPQLGNTKKRKVPAHAQGVDGHDPPGGGGGELDSETEHALLSGGAYDSFKDDNGTVAINTGAGALSLMHSSAAFSTTSSSGFPVGVAATSPTTQKSIMIPRGRMLPATRVGLAHKEMLRQRKRQLAALLDTLAPGDTLALDQALSAYYPLLATSRTHAIDGGLNHSIAASNGADSMWVRPRPLLRRHRSARRYATNMLRRKPPALTEQSASPTSYTSLPSGEFTFVCHSSSKFHNFHFLVNSGLFLCNAFSLFERLFRLFVHHFISSHLLFFFLSIVFAQHQTGSLRHATSSERFAD